MSEMREVVIPLHPNSWVVLNAAFPLSEEAWAQMMAVLDAMKPGLVVPPPAREGAKP